MVTREIKLFRTERYSLSDSEQDDLRDTTSKSGSGRQNDAADFCDTTKASHTRHYMDRYIMDQVDPLRQSGTNGVQAEVISDAIRRKDVKISFKFLHYS